MFNCSKEINKYHDEEVTLGKSDQDKMRGHRDANQARLKKGLEKNGDKQPKKFIKQGSYSMKTMVQHPNNDYDIDDGVVFLQDDLKGENGGDKTALDARKMVCDALQDDRFNKQPEVHTNCVRVFYNEGYHIDVPVYRQKKDKDDEYELASTEWKTSNPEGVTKWFDECLKRRKMSGDDNNQLRRMVRYLKKFSKSRDSWNMPSGFILTVLADERFLVSNDREDKAIYDLMVSIKGRLDVDLMVKHPVLPGETITKTNKDPEMVTLRDKLAWAIGVLKVLFDPECTKKAAFKAWGKVFNTDFFDQYIENGDKGEAAGLISVVTPSSPVNKKGGGQYA